MMLNTKIIYLVYTTNTIKSVEVKRILIDNNSLKKLIGFVLVDCFDFKKCEIECFIYLKMTNNLSIFIKHYTIVSVIIGNIMTMV